MARNAPRPISKIAMLVPAPKRYRSSRLARLSNKTQVRGTAWPTRERDSPRSVGLHNCQGHCRYRVFQWSCDTCGHRRSYYRQSTIDCYRRSIERDARADVEPTISAAPIVITTQKDIAQQSQRLLMEDAVKAKNGQAIIFLVGHIEYADIFFPDDPLHYGDWCFVLVSFPDNPRNTKDFTLKILREEGN
jgi:hypothetical protein